MICHEPLRGRGTSRPFHHGAGRARPYDQRVAHMCEAPCTMRRALMMSEDGASGLINRRSTNSWRLDLSRSLISGAPVQITPPIGPQSLGLGEDLCAQGRAGACEWAVMDLSEPKDQGEEERREMKDNWEMYFVVVVREIYWTILLCLIKAFRLRNWKKSSGEIIN